MRFASSIRRARESRLCVKIRQLCLAVNVPFTLVEKSAHGLDSLRRLRELKARRATRGELDLPLWRP